MKKITLIITVIAMQFLFSKANGQTAIQIVSMTDSIGVHCITPAYSGVNLDAYAIGYPNNSIFQIYIDFGDGTDTTFNTFSWGTTIQYINTYPEHTYLFPGNYTVTVIITGPDLNTAQLTNVDQAIVSNNCENITGKIYDDVNLNCLFDIGEFEFKYVPVKLYSGTTLLEIFYSDLNGSFSFNAPIGNNYTIELDESYWILNHGFIQSCTNVGIINFNLNGPMNFDFQYECSIANFDLMAGHIPGNGFVPGMIGYINPSFHNQSCQYQNGYVEIDLDPMVSYVINTGMAPSVISGNTLTWNFNSINNTNGYSSLQSLIGNIVVSTSTSAQIGDLVCFQTRIYPNIGDNNPSNNVNNKCYTIQASFDPNMKEVFPKGDGPAGLVDPNLSMTYTIYFQNTGTASAQNVFIIDTLDTDLDYSTLQVLGSSHEMNLYIANNSIVKFDFPNIQLPDSNSNEPLSHGFVTYEIMQKNNLFPGTEINNTAHIFFDYNEAIVTNTTLNTIKSPDGIEDISIDSNTIYPLPTSDVIFISNLISDFDYLIFDLTGKLIQQGENCVESKINLINVDAGMYQLILFIDGKRIEKLIPVVK